MLFYGAITLAKLQQNLANKEVSVVCSTEMYEALDFTEQWQM